MFDGTDPISEPAAGLSSSLEVVDFKAASFALFFSFAASEKETRLSISL